MHPAKTLLHSYKTMMGFMTVTRLNRLNPLGPLLDELLFWATERQMPDSHCAPHGCWEIYVCAAVCFLPRAAFSTLRC